MNRIELGAAVVFVELCAGDNGYGQGGATLVVSVCPFHASRRAQGGEQDRQAFLQSGQSLRPAAPGRLHLE